MVDIKSEFDKFKNMDLFVNMERGWPCEEQLALSMPMLNIIDSNMNLVYENDYRNYKGGGGILPARKLFADLLGATVDEVFVASVRSVVVMYNIIDAAMKHGFEEGKPWRDEGKIKIICPVPGYDSHFWMCETHGIEMIPVDILDDGPDMECVEELVKSDEKIKGIWCVPLYSNPTATIYSAKTINRLAKMKTAASDFKIFWDNAYIVHHLTDTLYNIENIRKLSSECGNEDRVFEFVSTSKITFPSGGISACATSINNMNWMRKLGIHTLCATDKLNQLRHVLFLKDVGNINKHMKSHRDIIVPKFNLVNEILKAKIDTCDVTWTKPLGGYFVTVDLKERSAKRVYELCKTAGVNITPDGTGFIKKEDPKDSILRLAPTYPSLPELEYAMNVFCTAVRLS